MKNIFIILLITLLFFSCEDDSVTNYEELNNEITSLDILDAIHLANKWANKYPDITIYVTYTQLIIEYPNNTNAFIPIPENQMYVVIAPYIETTHACETHYISSCQGELKETEFDLIIKEKDGAIFFDGSMTSLKNGFIELWLPKNNEFDLSIFLNSQKVQLNINTFETGITCITTAKLK